MPDYLYVLIGLSIIFIASTLGSAVVFFYRKKEFSPKVTKILTGFAAGVMFSASFFSLILPALESEGTYKLPLPLIVGISVLLGAGFLWLIDKLVPHIHAKGKEEEGIPTKKLSKTAKLVLAVTIHNIPEGLAVGIAFGVALASGGGNLMLGGLLLAIGIAIQNMPETAIIALPLKAETGSSTKAFFLAMLTGAIEPVAGLIGLVLAMQISAIMPWALAFAAGCMIYVVAEEMIPDMHSEGHDHNGVWSFMLGFVIMMVLDMIQA